MAAQPERIHESPALFRVVKLWNPLGLCLVADTVDDRNPALPSGPSTYLYIYIYIYIYGNGIFIRIMGNAGFISSTVVAGLGACEVPSVGS